MIETLIGLSFLLYMFSLIIFVRNKRVFKMCGDMLSKIQYAVQKDLQNGKKWIWRYNIYSSVSYDTMLWQFWKPIKPEAFYKDTSFLKAEIEHD